VFSKSKRKTASKIDTLIGSHTEIRGDVIFTGGLHVDGKVIGNVIAESGSGSVISLSEQGVIEGEVHVPNVVLNGVVIGDVFSDTHLELAEKARIKGNVYYSYIEMARGSEVNGSLVHQDGGSGSAMPERTVSDSAKTVELDGESAAANP